MFLGPASLFKFPIFLRQSDQEEKKDTPPSGPQKSPSLHTVSFVGDEQFNVMPYIWSVYRSLTADNFAPGLRLPLSNMGDAAAREMLLRQAVPVNEEGVHRGSISTGDSTDVASVEELNQYLEVVGKAAAFGHPLRLFVPGNHEVFHGGVADRGVEGGLLALLLGLGGEREFQRDVHGLEVGGEKNILDKGRMIGMVYKNLFGKKPKPVALLPSDKEGYLLKDKTRGAWKDTSTVFQRFWREERNGAWTAIVSHEEDQTHRVPLEQWLYVSASKLDEIQTPSGPHPLYIVGIDTVDFLADPASKGSIEGRISTYQAALIRAFIQETKRGEPRAKFILVGHYPLTQTAGKGGLSLFTETIPLFGPFFRPLNVEESVLKPILSDESVIAVVGAHTHNRGFEKNLCDPKFGTLIGGETPASSPRYCPPDREPLPQIVVPAVIDYPNETVLLRYGADERDPDKLIFEFQFKGIEAAAVPGLDDDVRREFEKLKPVLLTYLETRRHIRDPRFRTLTEPIYDSTYWRQLFKKFDLLVNIDRGALWDLQRANDQIVVHDVIPGMVEQAKVVLRAVLADIKVTLVRADLREEAGGLESAYLDGLDRLDRYYEKISQGIYSDVTGKHGGAHEIDEITIPIRKVTGEIQAAIARAMESPSAPPEDREDLRNIEHLLGGLASFTEEYKHWLVHYEENRRTKRLPSEMTDESNLFGKPSFRLIWNHFGKARYGSAAHALNTLLFLESSRLWFKYRNEDADGSIPKKLLEGGRGLNVPNTIRLEIEPSGAHRVIGQYLRPKEVKERLNWWPHLETQGKKEDGKSALVTITDAVTKGKGITSHWQRLFLGFSLGRGETIGEAFSANPFAPSGGNRGVTVATGFQWHVLNDWRLPRLNFSIRGGADFNWQTKKIEDLLDQDVLRDTFEIEVPVRAALTLGDPWGYFEFGALVMGGFAWRAEKLGEEGRVDRNLRSLWGYSLGFPPLVWGFLDNTILIEGSRRFYSGPSKSEWHFSLNFDVLRFFKILDGVSHEFRERSPSAKKIIGH